MMIIIQLVLFCLLFTLMVRLSAIGGGINALYFYPKAVQQKAFSLGLTDEKMMKRKKTVFFIPFLSVLLIALLLIIGLWNGVKDFWTAYFQSLLFLEVMNWYDGIVIDRLWVGHSKLWLIPEYKTQHFDSDMARFSLYCRRTDNIDFLRSEGKT